MKKKRKSVAGKCTVRPQNLAATVFVFERTKRPYKTHVVYLEQAWCYVNQPGWKHTATLDPAAWIESFINHPQERDRRIEELMARPNTTEQARCKASPASAGCASGSGAT
jgi:hypothetical protein